MSKPPAWAGAGAAGLEFDELVVLHGSSLYRFARVLAADEAEAVELVQQTFYVLNGPRPPVRDFADSRRDVLALLYREHQKSRRPAVPDVADDAAERASSLGIARAVGAVDELFRASLALSYLEDCTHRDIATILDLPVGAVPSRIARGQEQLRQLLHRPGPLEHDADASFDAGVRSRLRAVPLPADLSSGLLAIASRVETMPPAEPWYRTPLFWAPATALSLVLLGLAVALYA